MKFLSQKAVNDRANEILNGLTDEQKVELVSLHQKSESEFSGVSVFSRRMLHEAARYVAQVSEESGNKPLDGNELFKALVEEYKDIAKVGEPKLGRDSKSSLER